jgi:AraC family transcriptional regulator
VPARPDAAASDEYRRRIDRVIDHLRRHLDRPVNLDELAEVACFSKFHFHRVFSAVTGETVNACANRLRLEQAARQLRLARRPLTEIALACGFSSSAAFSRAFRLAYATTPSEYRRTGEIKESKIRKALAPGQEYVLPMTSEEKRAAFPVRIVDLPARTIAYIRVTNAFDQDRVIAAIGRIRDWARAQGILAGGTLFGMTMDDPDVTPAHLYRYEVCFASATPFEVADGMSRLTLPAMRYAMTSVSGDLRMVATAWDYLIREWLVRSAYEPEAAPALEIFRDARQATDWSHFELDGYFPIKALARTGA